jgi:hypothetical protein
VAAGCKWPAVHQRLWHVCDPAVGRRKQKVAGHHHRRSVSFMVPTAVNSQCVARVLDSVHRRNCATISPTSASQPSWATTVATCHCLPSPTGTRPGCCCWRRRLPSLRAHTLPWRAGIRCARSRHWRAMPRWGWIAISPRQVPQ